MPMRRMGLIHQPQRAHHGAYLVVQEGARGGFDPDLVAIASDGKTVQGLHRRGRLTFGGTECGEIAMADENLRRLVHGFGVEPVDDVPGALPIQHRRAAAIGDAVEVMARLR